MVRPRKRGKYEEAGEMIPAPSVLEVLQEARATSNRLGEAVRLAQSLLDERQQKEKK